MNSDVVSLACITKAIEEEPIIVFFEEARVSIIATLNNMTWYARQIHPCFSWHRNFLFWYKYRFPDMYDIFIIVRDSHVPPTHGNCVFTQSGNTPVYSHPGAYSQQLPKY
jgi:hypothetical protein